MDIDAIIRVPDKNELDLKIIEYAKRDSNPAELGDRELSSFAEFLGGDYYQRDLDKLKVAIESYVAFRTAAIGRSVQDFRFLQSYTPENLEYLFGAVVARGLASKSEEFIDKVIKGSGKKEYLASMAYDLACSSFVYDSAMSQGDVSIDDHLTPDDVKPILYSGRSEAIAAWVCLDGDTYLLEPLFSPASDRFSAAVEAYGQLGGDPMNLLSIFDDRRNKGDEVLLAAANVYIQANGSLIPLFNNKDVDAGLVADAYVRSGGDPQKLIPLFRDGSPDVRNAVAEAYVQLHGDPNGLLPLLRDGDAGVRAIAARTYGKLEGDPLELWPLLNDEDPDVRLAAIFAYAELNGDPKELLHLFDDGSEEIRRAARKAYNQLKGDHAVLLPLFEHEDVFVRVDAKENYVSLKGDPKALLPLLGSSLEGAYPRTSDVAVAAYVELNGDPNELLPLLRSEKTKVRVAAATAYGQTKGNPVELLPLFQDESPDVRSAVAFAYGKLNGDAEELLSLFNDSDPHVRNSAAKAYGLLNGDPKKLLPLFEDGDPFVRYAAVESYVHLNGDPDKLIPLFRNKDEYANYRRDFIKYYSQLKGNPAALLPLIRNEHKAVYSAAYAFDPQVALEQQSNPGKLIPLFICNRDEVGEIRTAAIGAYAKLGGDSKALHPLLKFRPKHLFCVADKHDPEKLILLHEGDLPNYYDLDFGIFTAAVGAYAELDGDPRRIVPLLNDDDHNVRRYAMRLYAEMGGDPKKLLPYFRDEDKDFRAVAAEAYIKSKGNPKELLPLFRDEDLDVRLLAIRTYRELT